MVLLNVLRGEFDKTTKEEGIYFLPIAKQSLPIQRQFMIFWSISCGGFSGTFESVFFSHLEPDSHPLSLKWQWVAISCMMNHLQNIGIRSHFFKATVVLLVFFLGGGSS